MPITKDGKAVAPVYNQPAEYQRGDLANWIGAVNEDLDVLPVGYRSISQLITKSALMVQGEDGQLTEFTNRDAANVAMNNQLSPVVQASLEGRLYVKLDDKLLQLHTEEVKGRYDTNFSLSEPMDAPLALEVLKVEEPVVEEPIKEEPVKKEPKAEVSEVAEPPQMQVEGGVVPPIPNVSVPKGPELSEEIPPSAVKQENAIEEPESYGLEDLFKEEPPKEQEIPIKEEPPKEQEIPIKEEPPKEQEIPGEPAVEGVFPVPKANVYDEAVVKAFSDRWQRTLENQEYVRNLGWSSIRDAAQNNALVLLGEDGQFRSVSHKDYVDNQDDFFKYSGDGRLWLKENGSDQMSRLKVVQPKKVDSQTLDQEFSGPYGLEDVKNVLEGKEPLVYQAELAKNEKAPKTDKKSNRLYRPDPPSFLFFKRIANGIFGAFKEELETYDKNLARYLDQKNYLAMRGEEKTLHVTEDGQAVKSKAPDSLDNFFTGTTVEYLANAINNPKPLDPQALENPATKETAELLDGYYQAGLQSRLQAINTLKNGDFRGAGITMFEDALGNVMVGELIYRAVTGPGKEGFYQQVKQNPDMLTNLKADLLNTPAVREVLAQKDEGLGRVLGISTQLSKLMDKAIPQTKAAKEALKVKNPQAEKVAEQGRNVRKEDPKTNAKAQGGPSASN